ncbi:actin binding Rho activating protein b [Hippocampus zosterae]|uniref:actin binding Rho activating protein b n=1 Tax=Hippocampus zosterae TaxID=109293 RepID=UPI00223E5BB5|nr:actin binding Rho activating protein b [Hippocampus zosterae]XP_051927516.1 actin binding Rho activating protein b [Hippocampus zosterae]
MWNQQISLWKASANKNVKELRAVSKVCGLAKSWQQWITDNEGKQATEPCGWSPWPGDSSEEPRMSCVATKFIPSQKTEEDTPHPVVAPKTVSDALNLPRDRTKIEDANNWALPMISTSIEMKLVMKNIRSGPQDRRAGVKLLAKCLEKSGSGEGADRLLETQSSLPSQRKRSNVLSSLTQIGIPVENEQKPGKVVPIEKQILGADPKQDRGLTRLETDDDDDASRSISAKICDGESSVKIKKPQILTSGKEAADANKINALSKKYSSVRNLKSRWQNWAAEHTDNQRVNPFSEYFDYEYSMSLRLQKGQDGYGRPKEGTKTAERAKRAEKHIHGEIADMCYIIRTMADPDQDGKTRVTFGELFDRYVHISDKVVGILMRARKHGKVHFEGEMLWQGQDDGVIITLLV